MIDNDPQQSRYGAQLERRFPLLNFEPALEAEYRAEHLSTIRMRVIISLFIAIAFSIWHVFSTRVDAAAVGSLEQIDQLRLWVMRPLSLVLLAVAFVPALYHRYWLSAAPAVLLAIGAVGAYNVAQLVAIGNLHAFISMLAGFFGLYLLMGLLFWQLLAVGSVLVAAYAANLVYHGAPIGVIQFETTVMLTVTGLAVLFTYTLEHSQRTAFLQRNVLEEIGKHDALTRLKNRRAFDERLMQLWQQAVRDERPLGLLLLDVDHFKAYNDRYGHQAGDRCLEAIGTVLRCVAGRPLDIAARIGGEEFAVLFYNCTHEHLVTTGERLVLGVQGLGIDHDRSPVAGQLTASVGGVLVQPTADRSPGSLMQFADEALYTAKDRGRNRVIIERDGYENVVTGAFRTQADFRRALG